MIDVQGALDTSQTMKGQKKATVSRRTPNRVNISKNFHIILNFLTPAVYQKIHFEHPAIEIL